MKFLLPHKKKKKANFYILTQCHRCSSTFSLSLALFYFTHPFHVSLRIEVAEENDKGNHVDDQGVLHPHREVAVRPDTVNAEDEGHSELNLHRKTNLLQSTQHRPGAT